MATEGSKSTREEETSYDSVKSTINPQHFYDVAFIISQNLEEKIISDGHWVLYLYAVEAKTTTWEELWNN